MSNLSKKIKRSFTTGKFAKGTNTFILIVVAVAIMVLANVLLEQLPLNIDTTAEGLYTLTDTTKKVLSELEEKIQIYALYDRVAGEADTGEGGRAEVIKILDLYDQSSKIDVEYIDLDKNPNFLPNTVGDTAAQNYAEGDVMVKCGDKIRRIDETDMYVVTQQTYNYFYTYNVTNGIQAETKLTSAICKVTSDVPVVYWSVGFGETAMSKYSTLIGYLEDSGFDFMELDLKTEIVPEDACCIMFVGPTEDINDSAYDKLERWLNKGHSAFFFMDMKSLTDEHVIYNDFTAFNKLFANYGITIEKTVVEETGDYKIANSGSDVIFKTNTRAVGSLEKMTKSTIYMLNSRSLDVDNDSDEFIEAEAIIQTSSGATAKGLDNENNTRSGISYVAASGKRDNGTTYSRICVFGTSWSFCDMALSYYGATAGEQTILTSMTWMDLQATSNVGDSIEAKEYSNIYNSSYVSVTETQLKVIVAIVMVALPIIIVLLGVIIWFRRRHL